MSERILFFVCVFTAIWEAKSMALKGPVLTRYDPCGLGLIHFDRFSENYWGGIVHFGLYTTMVEAEMVIVFKNEVTVSTHSNINNFTARRTNKRDLVVHVARTIPMRYIFYVATDNLKTNESDVPIVNILKLNNVILCNDKIKHSNINNFTARRTNKRDLVVHVARTIPMRYIFYVATDNLKTNESDVPIVNILKLNNVILCNDKIKAAQTITRLNVTQPFSSNQYAHVCGRRSINHTELMSVRTEARAGDWPWHVALLVKNRRNVLKYHCGGNIVSRTAILTAGHCVFKNGITTEANRVVIIAGTNNHQDVNQPGRQTLIAQKIILHPAYNDDLSTSDLAIIRVNTLEFTEYVQPVCIWGPVYDKANLFGKEATVVGFGTTEHNKPAVVLRSTYTRIQNDTTCINFSRKLYSGLLNEFTFCAGYGPTSTINPRNGDSGGGLVLSTIQPDHMISYFVRGVLSKCGVSPGQKVCDSKYYVVYTDVAPHYGWIYHHAGLEFRNNVMVS